jgi:hypothetical protein
LRLHQADILHFPTRISSEGRLSASGIVRNHSNLFEKSIQFWDEFVGHTPSRENEVVMPFLSELDSGLNATSLRRGNVSIPDSPFWGFCMSDDDSFRRCAESDLVGLKSLAFSVSSPGGY